MARPALASCLVLLAASAVACGGSASADGDRSVPDGGSLDAQRDSIFEAGTETIAEDSSVIVDTPPPSVDFAPVCGCDGITYWNAEQAAARGVSVCDTNECALAGSTAGRCGANPGKSCPAGTTCVTDNYNFCFVGDSAGYCWSIPPGAACPADKGVYRDCTTSTCINYCQAVKTGKLVYGC